MVHENITKNGFYPQLENPNFLPVATTVPKPGHRRNASTVTITSIKTVAMKGSVIDNLLVNFGVRGNTSAETKRKNLGMLISMLVFL